jgi:hypothetical protein
VPTFANYNGLDAMADGIIGHSEGHKRGIASNHGDPNALVSEARQIDGYF